MIYTSSHDLIISALKRIIYETQSCNHTTEQNNSHRSTQTEKNASNEVPGTGDFTSLLAKFVKFTTYYIVMGNEVHSAVSLNSL